MSAANLLAAHAYAQRGWPVFVLSASKVPVANCDHCRETDHDMESCPCLTCHGFYAATLDPDRIDAMHDKHPSGLLAIRTGAPSGLVVVDIDVVDGGGIHEPPWTTVDALDAAGVLPNTLTVVTGSGGWHMLYQHPGWKIPSGAGKLGPKVDVKADGAYVVAAPSIHPRTHKPYRWANTEPVAPLHPALANRLREPAPPVRTPAHHTDRVVQPHRRLGGLLTAVMDAPTGRRNDVLHWAAFHAGQMVSAGEITETQAVDALTQAGARAGLTHTEMVGGGEKGTIGSGLNKGMRA